MQKYKICNYFQILLKKFCKEKIDTLKPAINGKSQPENRPAPINPITMKTSYNDAFAKFFFVVIVNAKVRCVLL